MPFNPSEHNLSSTATGFSNATPPDARSMFYDGTVGKYRDYQSTAEVLSYLNLARYRTGHFPIYIHNGGTLASGVWTGGTMIEYWFKDGTANGNLVVNTSAVRSIIATYGATTTINTDIANFARLVLTGDTILAFSGSPVDGQGIVLAASASGANRTVTLDPSFVIPSSVLLTSPIIILSGTETFLGFKRKASTSKWQLIAYVTGQS